VLDIPAPHPDPLVRPGEDALITLAAAVADGGALDWGALQSSAIASHDLLPYLKALSTLVRLRHDEAPLSHAVDTSQDAGPRTQLDVGLDRWGPLELREKIGRGRFGDVYRAWDPGLHREVALKLLRETPASGAGTDARVVAEGRLMARVRHPNVATIFGALHAEGRTGLWMEFIQGRTLHEELRDRGPFGEDELRRVGVESCRALQAVHTAGLVHRDVKAQNVMREGGGRLVLADFGTGRDLGDGPEEEPIAGTPLYLAPELFRGERASPASDLYALGVLLFHLATGRYPVEGRTFQELRDAHARGARRAPGTDRPNLPRDLLAAIDRALAPEPGARFESALAMEIALSGGDARASATAAATTRPTGRLTAIAMAAAAAIAGIAWALAAWSPAADANDPPRLPNSRAPAQSTVTPAADRADVPSAETSLAPDAAVDDDAPVFPLNPGAWAIVAFENRTGEEGLGRGLELALRSNLHASTRLKVASHLRVGDALAAMQLPRDTSVDRTRALEVSRRDAGISAIVAATLEPAGERYRLSVHLLDPRGEGRVRSTATEVVDRRQLLAAVRQLASVVRRAFGDSPPAREAGGDKGGALTASVEAWLSYAAAAEEMARIPPTPVLMGRSASAIAVAAEPLLRSALTDDPDFQQAHLLLAWSLMFQGRHDEAGGYASRAVELQTRAVPGHGALAQAATHYLRARAYVSGSPEAVEAARRSVSAYDEALASDADFIWAEPVRGWNVGVTALTADRRRAQLILADARPLDYEANAKAAWTLYRTGSLVRARQYASRAAAAGFPEQPKQGAMPIPPPGVDLFEAFVDWKEGRTAAVAAALDRLEASGSAFPPHQGAQAQAMELAFALGRLRQAERFIPPTSIGSRADLMALRGDVEGLRRVMERSPDFPAANIQSIPFFLKAGMVERATAEAAKAAVDEGAPPGSRLGEQIASGVLALAEGRAADAVAALRAAAGRPSPTDGLRILVLESLAAALEADGDTDAAIATLRSINPFLDAPVPQLDAGRPPPLWPHVRAQGEIARLLRESGRAKDAIVIEMRLSAMLAHADADHPLLLQLRAVRAGEFGGSVPVQ
jgi:tetratricopeptide (TPR) repeat protein